MRTSVKTVTVSSLLVASFFVTPAAFAADSTATATVTGGQLTASAENVVLGEVATSHTTETSPGVVTVGVNDERGTGEGWSVTQSVGDFSYTGDNAGDPIVAANFAVTSVGDITREAGVDGIETVTAGGAGTLDAERTVLSAAADGGEGSYSAPVNVALTVPEGSRAGTYAATLTTTTAAAPAIN
ncbi:WxL domain-containing protein [Nesterenkonia sp. Act20]|uniref:WxL domain-containing protein n=1 Tax=Nesterenkonia sp. Act20 TaxID=1483432 RepID=UPI001C483D22|nr:WxL domain-containing protein [Nesterenkonia sp. Act20]